MDTQAIPGDEVLPFGSAEPPRSFEDEPTTLIFDLNHYFADPPIDLKPFHDIVTIKNDENALDLELSSFNRSFTVVPILPQWNNPQIETFVEQKLLESLHVNNFSLFFIDGQVNNLGALCGTRLTGCYPITSRISAQTRAICATTNDENIDFCERLRCRNEMHREFDVAKTYAKQKYDRLNLQLTFIEQLQRELE